MKSSSKNIYIILSVLICFFCIPFIASAEESASAIMERCATKFKNAPAIKAQFSIEGGAKPISGTLIMSRSRFCMQTPLLSIWYNGKTQWTYISENKEVDITEPTHDELMESNPFEVITNFNTNYKCRKLKSPASADIIELSPKSAGQPIIRAKISISKSTGWPTAIDVTFDGGNSSSIAISKIESVNKLPATAFEYDKTKFPASEIIDLR